MADHFLSKIRVAPEDFVSADGRPVLDRQDELHRLLAERAGPEVAALFAEPLVSHGNDSAPPTVAWYGQSPGEARPLDSLPPAERDRAEAYLADHLRPLRVLSESPETAELALGALSTYGSSDVLVVGNRPVIVNWGLMPGGNGANAASRPEHFAVTLGRFMSLSSGVDAAPAGASRVPQTETAPAARPMAATVPAGTPDAAPARLSPIAWVPLLLLLILAGAVLTWLLWPGTRLFARSETVAITDQQTLNAARALNQSLRERQALLQTALDGAQCRPDGVLVLPDGRTPEGLMPPAIGVAPARQSAVVADAALPSNPARVLVPGDTSGGGEASLLQLIEARTMLVLASPGGTDVISGTGFVIGPGLVVTNRHVIEPALGEGGQILVTGDALAAPQPAEVLKTQGPLAQTGGDFALLRIEDTSVPAFSVHVPQVSLKLQNVVAAGYPGDVLATDADYAALKSGDLSAVPGLTVTDGTVNTEQQIGPRTHVLMHSAALSSGNSGGPLVDMCGRLVGVNTFVRKGRLQNRGFALTSADLLNFLKDTAAAPEVVGTSCAPVVQRAEAKTSAPAAK
ncbi:trypsin-like peptidase domain-containing protein [Rhodobacteraceae bacterium F11138]|nr:trypsin-like peptidase domain-containing protein [Rhodobacteraceae bacterium F11138]